MTTAILTTPAIRAPLIPSYCRRIGTGILLVVLADFLFRGQPAGISALLFGIVLAATVVAMDPTALNDGRVWLKPAALFAALLPLVENVGPLSVAAPGLALIIARIALTKSKKWPPFANLPTLSAALYAGCFDRKVIVIERRDPSGAVTEARYRDEQKNRRVGSFRNWRLSRALDKRGPLVVPQGYQPAMPDL